VVNSQLETDGEPYFLFVGTLEPRKNLEGLLAAYNLFLQDAASAGRPEAQIPNLVLAGGSGWGQRNLRRRMEILIQMKKLQVLDFCAPEQLWTIYRGATALLFPSLHEGFGFPILEGMAAQIPVMTSARGAMAEVAGQAALLVDPLDTTAMAAGLEKLAWNMSFRQELMAKGQIRARAFSWQSTATATIAVYRQVLAGGMRPAI
jgi:glycosyltransferase involved in cell wall biosynthesis